MSDQSEPSSISPKTPQFTGSLVRTVVIGLLLISLVPALIIGTATFLRTQRVLRQQTISQIETISKASISQLEQFELSRAAAIEKIKQDPYLSTAIIDLLRENTDPAFTTAVVYVRNYLADYIAVPTDKIFDQLTMVNSAGLVLVSTDRSIPQTDFSQNEYLKTLINTNQSQLVLNPGNLFPDQLVLLSTRTIERNNKAVVTVFGFSKSVIPASTLKTAQSLFPSGKSYLSTGAGTFVSYDATLDSAVKDGIGQEQKDLLINNISKSGVGKNFQYQNETKHSVFSYIAGIPSLQSAFILEVPEDAILSQVRSILPFLFILLAAIIIISVALVTYSARSIVLPLTTLAKNAQTFAAGDWSFRAKTNRRDEIGLLAYSFNLMVEQLTGFYRSLESKVEEKTKLLRTASEVAQNAISSPTRPDIFDRMTQLLVEKLNFDFVGFYLVDEKENNAYLTSTYCKNTSLTPPEKGLQKTISIDSIVGWAGLNKQARVCEDLSLEKFYKDKTGILTGVSSQLAIPVKNANTMYGILDLQSLQSSTFDPEMVSILTSFADQIAAGLRNIQGLESAQGDLRVTTMLYQISRLISQSKTTDEVNTHITELFSQSELVTIFFTREDDLVKLTNFTDQKGTEADQSLRGFNIPLAKGLSTLAESGVLILENLKHSSDFSNLLIHFERRGCNSVALLPIYESGILSSILALGSRSTEPLTMLQIQPYLSFSEVIGTTLERIHLLDQLNQHVTELQAIATVGEAASTASDLNDLFTNLFEKLKTTIGGGIGFAVALNNKENASIKVPFYMDGEKVDLIEYQYSDDLTSQTITSGSTIRHRDANSVGMFVIDAYGKRMPTRSFLGIPLKLGADTIGALMVFDRKDANRFTDAHLDLLSTLAPQISTSIRNVELLESQRTALKAYDKERFLLNSLLENIPDKIVIKDNKGKFLRVSKSYAESVNIPNPKSLENQTEFEAGLKTESNNDLDLITLDSGISQIGEIEENVQGDGTKKWSLTSKIILNSEDIRDYSLLKISRDITDLVTTQQVAEHRADQLITATEIARETSTGSMQIDETLKRLVELVKSRFNFYHASIFLIDPIGQYAVLRESTGEAGAKLMETGHKLAVGSPSIVGQATGNEEAVVVNDVTKEENYYPNPLLPETRSEMAIPLKIGSKLIGALDVQSQNLNAFSKEDVNILQIMADQLSVAIENANLFSKTQKTLERHRLLHQITSAAGQSSSVEDAIKNSVQTIHLAMPNDQITFVRIQPGGVMNISASSGYSAEEILSLKSNSANTVVELTTNTRKPIRVDDTLTSGSGSPLGNEIRSTLTVPVEYGERLIGLLNVESKNSGEFDENDQEIITTLANNLASIIANIELVEQIRLQVDRQRQLYDITSKIRRSVDVETIMQTSLTEVCKTLNIRKASIRLNSSPTLVPMGSIEKAEEEAGK